MGGVVVKNGTPEADAPGVLHHEPSLLREMTTTSSRSLNVAGRGSSPASKRPRRTLRRSGCNADIAHSQQQARSVQCTSGPRWISPAVALLCAWWRIGQRGLPPLRVGVREAPETGRNDTHQQGPWVWRWTWLRPPSRLSHPQRLRKTKTPPAGAGEVVKSKARSRVHASQWK